jgi:tetratricopeptide (TPR) repeat protein
LKTPTIHIGGKPYTPGEAATLAHQESQAGHFQVALDIYNSILALFPDSAEGYYNRGIIQNQMKRLVDALASFDQAIALKPDTAEFHNNRGVTLQEMRRYAEALASYDKALALRPNIVQAWNNRGVTLYEMKRSDDALASYDKAIMLKPDYADAYTNRGAALERIKRYDEAVASFDQALALKPNDATTCQRRGDVMVYKGNMLEAERMFLKSFALKPDLPDSLCSLANIRKFQDPHHPIVAQIQILLKKPDIPPLHQECLYFALGKIYDDCDRYDEAFECYRQANQIRNATVCYDRHNVRSTTTNIIEVFSKDFFAQPCAFASDSQTPLIIVGMPRSGTTLMASIFSNHRSVATAGELVTISDLTANLRRAGDSGVSYPQAAIHVSMAQAASLINAYEQRLRRDIGLAVPHVIDKHPLNFRHLGFIAMLFPKARIIHCTRHPLDTGLSNYFQRFHEAYDYSFDLGNIGHFYGEYARLMAHWRNVLPTKMIEISYEELVLNTEPAVRRALTSIGLEWDEGCLAPHRNPCVVETASKWQVRQPIHSRSVQRWRHYEKHLGPLKEALVQAGQIGV